MEAFAIRLIMSHPRRVVLHWFPQPDEAAMNKLDLDSTSFLCLAQTPHVVPATKQWNVRRLSRCRYCVRKHGFL